MPGPGSLFVQGVGLHLELGHRQRSFKTVTGRRLVAQRREIEIADWACILGLGCHQLGRGQPVPAVGLHGFQGIQGIHGGQENFLIQRVAVRLWRLEDDHVQRRVLFRQCHIYCHRRGSGDAAFDGVQIPSEIRRLARAALSRRFREFQQAGQDEAPPLGARVRIGRLGQRDLALGSDLWRIPTRLELGPALRDDAADGKTVMGKGHQRDRGRLGGRRGRRRQRGRRGRRGGSDCRQPAIDNAAAITRKVMSLCIFHSNRMSMTTDVRTVAWYNASRSIGAGRHPAHERLRLIVIAGEACRTPRSAGRCPSGPTPTSAEASRSALR